MSTEYRQSLWIDTIIGNLYENKGWFVNESQDFSQFANAKELKIPRRTARPLMRTDVTTNPPTVPISMGMASDTLDAQTVAMRYITCGPSIILNLEEAESQPSMMQNEVIEFQEYIEEQVSKYAAWAFSPASNQPKTPVLVTTGDVVDGRRKLTLADVVRLKRQLDSLKIPKKGRSLVLSNQHVSDILEIDLASFKTLLPSIREADLGEGQGMFCGFKLFECGENPHYDSGLNKLDFGTEPGASDKQGSFAFSYSRTCHARAAEQVFIAENDPTFLGDVISLQARFTAAAIGDEGTIAIVDGDPA